MRALVQLRDEAGITNQELIDRAGMSTSYFYARMRGTSPFDTNDMEKLAAALDVHPHEISRVAAAMSDQPIEPVVNLDRKELARRVKQILRSPLGEDGDFSEDAFFATLVPKGLTLATGEWSSLTRPKNSDPVRVRLLEALAEYASVAPGYLTTLGDKEQKEATDAQLDLRCAIRDTGAASISARAVGDVSPAALRAIAASLRSISG